MGYARIGHEIKTSAKRARLRAEYGIEAAAVSLWAWAEAQVFASAHLTDGEVPESEFDAWGGAKALDPLRAVGLVEASPNVGMVVLVGYLKHNTSRAHAEKVSGINKKNGKRGGVAKSKRIASEPLSESLAKEKRSISISISNSDLISDPDPRPVRSPDPPALEGDSPPDIRHIVAHARRAYAARFEARCPGAVRTNLGDLEALARWAADTAAKHPGVPAEAHAECAIEGFFASRKPGSSMDLHWLVEGVNRYYESGLKIAVAERRKGAA